MISQKFSPSYINDTFGLIFGQMSVSHRQYFLIRFKIIFGEKFRIQCLASQQFLQAHLSLKHSFLNRDITIGRDHYWGSSIINKSPSLRTPKLGVE